MYVYMCAYTTICMCVYVCNLFPSFHPFGVKMSKFKKYHQCQRCKLLHIMFQGERA